MSHRKILNPLFFILLLFIGSCKKNSVDTTIPVLKLKPDNITIKAGKTATTTLFITAPNGAKNVAIYKTINLKKDNTYGSAGLLTAVPASTASDSFVYNFTYNTNRDEIDKLVGFNFRFTDNKGNTSEKDLTVNTLASAYQTIYSRKWKPISKLWTSQSPAIENISDCEKDDTYRWNKDSTITINYGSSGCMFDGFNIYDKWTISDDEKTFKQIYHSVFDPTNITTEIYKVISVAPDKLVLQIYIDLSWLGLSNKEVFTYTFVPTL